MIKSKNHGKISNTTLNISRLYPKVGNTWSWDVLSLYEKLPTSEHHFPRATRRQSMNWLTASAKCMHSSWEEHADGSRPLHPRDCIPSLNHLGTLQNSHCTAVDRSLQKFWMFESTDSNSMNPSPSYILGILQPNYTNYWNKWFAGGFPRWSLSNSLTTLQVTYFWWCAWMSVTEGFNTTSSPFSWRSTFFAQMGVVQCWLMEYELGYHEITQLQFGCENGVVDHNCHFDRYSNTDSNGMGVAWMYEIV